MILTEYDEQKVRNAFYEDGRLEGIDVGLERGRTEGIDVGRLEGIDVGRLQGIDVGRTEGICALIADNLEEGIPKERIIEKLKSRFNLTQERAEEYFDKVISE